MINNVKTIAAAMARVAKIEADADLSQSQVSKLVYYAHALNMAESNEPLFDGCIQAFSHGPSDIQLSNYMKQNQSWLRMMLRSPKPQLPDYIWNHLRDVFHIFGGLTDVQLSNAAKAERPWIVMRAGYAWDAQLSLIISDVAIKDFYNELLEDGEDAMNQLEIAPEPDAPKWALPYRLGVNMKRIQGHPFFNNVDSRRVRLACGLAEFPDDWSDFEFKPLHGSADIRPQY